MKCGGAGELNLMLDGCVCPEPLEVGASFTVEGIFHSVRNHKGNSDFLAVEMQLPLSLPVAGVQLLSFVWAVVAQALPPHAKQSSIW